MLKTNAIVSERVVENLSISNNEPEWLLKKRLEALKFFSEIQMPSFIYGLNVNLNLELDLNDINPEIAEKTSMIIKNKNKDIIIENFSDMLKNHETILKEKFMSCVSATNKFTSFHLAFLNNLTFVYIPKNVEVKEPIEITSNIKSRLLLDHLIILAEDNTKVTLVENSNSKNEGYRSKIVEIFVGDNAVINYGNVQFLNNDTTNFTIKRAIIGKNSMMNWMDCCFGSKVTISEITTFLNGDGALTNNHGVFFGNKSQQFDLVANSIHKAPNTVSDIHTKGVLTDKSKCIYRGLVKIHDNAFGSNGYQKEDTLILSKDAIADSIPNLEIDNNDVRCTHGATIGRIDKEKLFYMQSRGLSEEEATREYVKGFFEPLIKKIKIEKLRENMHNMIEERCNNKV